MVVVPFPRIRDRAFVEKQASWLASLPMATAEKQLARQLHVQRETMVRRGIALDLIEEQVVQIEFAIREAMFNLGDSSGGVA